MKKIFFILAFACLVNSCAVSDNNKRGFSFDEYIFYKSTNIELGKDKISDVLNNNKSIQKDIKEIKYLYDDANISDAFLINNVYLTEQTRNEIVKSLTPFIKEEIIKSYCFSEVKKIVSEINKIYSTDKANIKNFLKSKINNNIEFIYVASNDEDYVDSYAEAKPEGLKVSKFPAFIKATEKGYISDPYVSSITGDTFVSVTFLFFDNNKKYVIGFDIKIN